MDKSYIGSFFFEPINVYRSWFASLPYKKQTFGMKVGTAQSY